MLVKILKFIKEKELVLTLLSGFLFVITTAILIMGAVYFKSMWKQGQIIDEGHQIEVELGEEITDGSEVTDGSIEKEVYVVQPGDSLWSLAEKKYGDGMWHVYLAGVNGLEVGSWLEVGQQLKIPDFDQVAGVPQLEADQYLVQPGDSLWWIAQEQFGDGGQWVDIYEVNVEVVGNNPDLIYPKMVLNISSLQACGAAADYCLVQ